MNRQRKHDKYLLFKQRGEVCLLNSEARAFTEFLKKNGIPHHARVVGQHYTVITKGDAI
jgi:hypothetical protein